MSDINDKNESRRGPTTTGASGTGVSGAATPGAATPGAGTSGTGASGTGTSGLAGATTGAAGGRSAGAGTGSSGTASAGTAAGSTGRDRLPPAPPRGSGASQGGASAMNAGGSAGKAGKSAGSKARSTFEDATDQAKSHARGYAEQAREQAGELTGTMRRLAKDAAERRKAAGAETLGGVAEAARNAADDLESELPIAAHYVREAADGIDRLSTTLNEKSVDEMLTSVSDVMRRQPVAVFAGALIAGLAVSRFIMAGSRTRSSRQDWQRTGARARYAAGSDLNEDFDSDFDDDDDIDMVEDHFAPTGGNVGRASAGATGSTRTASPVGGFEPKSVGLKGTPGHRESSSDATNGTNTGGARGNPSV